MNILVCISNVPDTTSKINFIEENTKLDSNGIQFVINPYDEFCLTKAVMLKESMGASITVVTVGDASAEPVIRKSLAIGADSASVIGAGPATGNVSNSGRDSYRTVAQAFNAKIPNIIKNVTIKSFFLVTMFNSFLVLKSLF